MATIEQIRQRAIEDVLLVARVFLGKGEDRKHHKCDVAPGAGDNHGYLMQWFLGEVGLSEGYPWCMAYVNTVGKLALGPKAQRNGWPLLMTAGCQAMYDWAKEHHPKRIFKDPAIGDVFLMYFEAKKRYAHTGFVTGVEPAHIATIEGNTNEGGSREGWGVCARQRSRGPSVVYIRWPELLGAP